MTGRSAYNHAKRFVVIVLVILVTTTKSGSDQNSTTLTTTELNEGSSSLHSYRRWIAALYLTINSFCLLLYLLFFKVFIGNYEASFAQQPFYVLVLHLALGDVGLCIGNLFVQVPYSYFGRPLFDGALNTVAAGLTTIFYFAVASASLLIAFDRLSRFMWPVSVHKRIFRRPTIYRTSMVIWLLPVYTFVLSSFSCPKDYDCRLHKYFYRCPPPGQLHPIQMQLMRIVWLTPTAMGVAIVMIYTAIAIKVYTLARIRPKNDIDINNTTVVTQPTVDAETTARTKRDADKRNRWERRVLIQGAIIGLTLVASNLAFNFATVDNFGVIGPVFATVMVSVNNVATPIVYYCFNGIVRQQINKLFGCAATDADQTLVAVRSVTSRRK